MHSSKHVESIILNTSRRSGGPSNRFDLLTELAEADLISDVTTPANTTAASGLDLDTSQLYATPRRAVARSSAGVARLPNLTAHQYATSPTSPYIKRLLESPILAEYTRKERERSFWGDPAVAPGSAEAASVDGSAQPTAATPSMSFNDTGSVTSSVRVERSIVSNIHVYLQDALSTMNVDGKTSAFNSAFASPVRLSQRPPDRPPRPYELSYQRGWLQQEMKRLHHQHEVSLVKTAKSLAQRRTRKLAQRLKRHQGALAPSASHSKLPRLLSEWDGRTPVVDNLFWSQRSDKEQKRRCRALLRSAEELRVAITANTTATQHKLTAEANELMKCVKSCHPFPSTHLLISTQFLAFTMRVLTHFRLCTLLQATPLVVTVCWQNQTRPAAHYAGRPARHSPACSD